jgi:DNA-directed RNA polymerase subunit M/transcription elongation factor TFIIS
MEGRMTTIFRCEACGYELSEEHEDVELIRDIKDWINYILRVKHDQGFTATYANQQGVPCPRCQEKRRWVNV